MPARVEQLPTVVFILLKTYCLGLELLPLLSASKELLAIGKEVIRIAFLAVTSQKYLEKEEIRERIHSRLKHPSLQLSLSIGNIASLSPYVRVYGISILRVHSNPLIFPKNPCFANLRSLSLRFQTSITAIDDLPCLEVLKLSLCSDLEEIGSKLPRLRKLIASQCPSLQIICSPTVHQLVTLEIDQCRRFFPDYSALTSVKHLALTDILRYTFDESFLPVFAPLESLRIAGHNNFLEFIQSQFAQSSNHLQVLEFTGAIHQISPAVFPSLSKLILHSGQRNYLDLDFAHSPKLTHFSLYKHMEFFTISNYSLLVTVELIDCRPPIPIDLTPFGSIRNLVLRQCNVVSFAGLGIRNFSLKYEEYYHYEYRDMVIDFSPLQTIPFVTISHARKLTNVEELASSRIKHLILDSCDQIMDVSMLGMIEKLELKRLNRIRKLDGLENVKELIVLDCFALSGPLSFQHRHHEKLVFDSGTKIIVPSNVAAYYRVERSPEGHIVFLQRRPDLDDNEIIVQEHHTFKLIRNSSWAGSSKLVNEHPPSSGLCAIM